MKVTDLMIDDWVVGCSGEPFKIGIIDPDFLHWNEIQPIPLTPEILEKNEFFKSYDDDGIHYKYTLISDGIGFSLKYVRSVFQWLGPLDFKYVHELQHALKLCGIKKEIEL